MRKAIVVLALILSACNSRDLIERFTPKEDKAFAIRTFERLQQRHFDEVVPLLDDTIPRDGLEAKLTQMADSFDNQKPIDVHVVGARTFWMNGIKRVYLTLEYQMPDNWVVAGMTIRTQDGRKVVEAFSAFRTLDSLEHLNRFTFRGKGATQYAYLLLAVLVPLFILVTLYVLWRTPVARRKWLWFIFVAFGICTMSVNWTTGETGMRLLWAQLLGFGFDNFSPYAPVVVSWAIPVGAIVFLLRRRSLMSPRVETYT
jgi:hypothetical protein